MLSHTPPGLRNFLRSLSECIPLALSISSHIPLLFYPHDPQYCPIDMDVSMRINDGVPVHKNGKDAYAHFKGNCFMFF